MFYHADFEELWKLWPKKIKKRDAYDAWIRKPHTAPPHGEMLAIVGRHAEWHRRNSSGSKYVPNLAAWFDGRRWEDELDEEDWEGERERETAFGYTDPRYDETGRYIGVKEEN